MPLARIDLLEGNSAEWRRTLAGVVCDRIIACFGVPGDQFLAISDRKSKKVVVYEELLELRPVRKLDLQRRAEGGLLAAVAHSLGVKVYERPQEAFFTSSPSNGKT